MADHVANMRHPGSKQNISWCTYASAGANGLSTNSSDVIPLTIIQESEFNWSVPFICPSFPHLINLVVTIQLKNCWKWKMWLPCACLYSHVLNLWWFLSTIDKLFKIHFFIAFIVISYKTGLSILIHLYGWWKFNSSYRSIWSILENQTVTYLFFNCLT